jgi:ethanolamine utilization cobalamin adenosyltransferase
MAVITEAELRELWRNGQGTLPSFPAGVRFSASAQDFLKSHGLTATIAGAPAEIRADWDRPGTFPVVLSGDLPVCAECGQPVRAKPSHMTQLDATTYAPKTAPRLKLRGRVDSLHAFVMLAAAVARRERLVALAAHLDTLAAYCREIMSAEYNVRPVAPLTLAGMNEAQLHAISHWPDRHLGIDHIVPGAADSEMLHWLNVVRTQAREVEVVALETFVPTDLAHALNRLSSAVYVLELMLKAGKL